MKDNVMWIGIMGFALLCLLASVWHLTAQLGVLLKTGSIVSLAIIAIVFLMLTKIFSFTNAMIIFIYFFIFTLISELGVFLMSKVFPVSNIERYPLLMALAVSLVFFTVSYRNLFNVNVTAYSLETDRIINNDKDEKARIVMFSDSHVGTTFSGTDLLKYVNDISELDPDIVVIAGDFIDDATSKEDMIAACESLKQLKTKYGVYFSFGNHDKGYYASKRGYDGNDLISELTRNNVTVLQDEAVLINNSFYLIGRKDKSDPNGRKDISELIKDLDHNRYMVVLDHQPNDYKNETDSKTDLVLSGHTHGGQMFPMGIIGELMGANDFTYGLKKIEETTFIVSSGISDWELLFKSGTHSEYVVIDIESHKQ